MKTYIVYRMGVEIGYVKGYNHNDAEDKAWKKYRGGPMTMTVRPKN